MGGNLVRPETKLSPPCDPESSQHQKAASTMRALGAVQRLARCETASAQQQYNYTLPVWFASATSGQKYGGAARKPTVISSRRSKTQPSENLRCLPNNTNKISPNRSRTSTGTCRLTHLQRAWDCIQGEGVPRDLVLHVTFVFYQHTVWSRVLVLLAKGPLSSQCPNAIQSEGDALAAYQMNGTS